MKKAFFLMAVLVMGSLCFTSCNKDDKKDDPTPEPETPIDVKFAVAIAENQLKYIEQTFEIDVNGKAVSFSVSQMNKVNDKSQYESIKMYADLYEDAGNYDIYDYKLGSLSSGQSVTAKSLSFRILSDRPQNDSLNYLQAWDVYNISGKKPVSLLTSNNFSAASGVKYSYVKEFTDGLGVFFDFKVTY